MADDMPEPIQIQEMRLTFLWTETTLAMLTAQNPEKIPYGFLARDYSYKESLQNLLQGGLDPRGLTLPWLSSGGNHFWKRYLRGKAPMDIDHGEAWKYLVPLRGRLKYAIQPAWTEDRKACQVAWEGYFYPFGSTLSLTVYLRGSFSLEQAVEAAHQAYRKGDYQLLLKDTVVSSGRLATTGDVGLKILRQAAMGEKAPAGIQMLGPLSIVTVVKGTGIDPTVDLAQHPDRIAIQRTLEALTNWQANWKTVKLPALDAPGVSLDIASKYQSAGDVMYASRQPDGGRTVWFPGRFTLQELTSALGCYHRNQVTGSMQALSLARFLRQLTQDIAVENRNQATGDCARNAAQILRDLYTGAPQFTYRSFSLRALIEQGEYKPALDQALVEYGLPAIP